MFNHPKTKPVENWEKELSIGLDNIIEDFNSYIVRNIDELFSRIFSYNKKFISSLLQEQAEHFEELGEELRKKPDEEALRLGGMDRMSERYLSASVEAVKFHGYNQGISDFQEAIKKEGE